MAGVDLVPLVDEGLGNSAYLVDLGDGRALVVDVSRDLRGGACGRGQARVDGGVRCRHPPACRFPFRRTPTRRDQRSEGAGVGGRCTASSPTPDCTTATRSTWAGCGCVPCLTPGHTHEHMAFLLLDGDREVGVFTGGSLIVGSAARTDLVSEDRTDELTRAQYASLHRLAALPGDVQVWPTHGAGSFCSAPPGAERTSTIAHELATNPLLQAPTKMPSWHSFSARWAAIRRTSAGSVKSTGSARRCWTVTPCWRR